MCLPNLSFVAAPQGPQIQQVHCPIAAIQETKIALAWIHRSTVGVKLISIVCLQLGRATVGRG